MVKLSEAVVHQSIMFVNAVCWGLMLGLSYDMVQIIRYIIKHNKWLIVIGDILFWIVWACVIYGLLYRYDSGLIRSYTIIGMTLGICGFMWIHNKLKKIVNSFLKVLKKKIKPVTIRQVNEQNREMGDMDGKDTTSEDT